ncbi:hypothetical protein Tco_0523207 [Tanacetum coccineum]
MVFRMTSWWQSAEQLRVLKTKMALIESRSQRSIKISLGHIPFQTLVEHHQIPHAAALELLECFIKTMIENFDYIAFGQTFPRYCDCWTMSRGNNTVGRLYGFIVSVSHGIAEFNEFDEELEMSDIYDRMDDPNMTMEEYIKLEEEKARRRGRVFNWETATYGNIRVDDDLHDLRSVEAEFPATVIDDAFAPQDAFRCTSLGMLELMRDGLFARMVMEHRDDADVVVFTSQAWGRLFDTRGPLVWELILEFLSTLRFGEVLLDLDAPGTIQFQLGGARRRLSWRQFYYGLGITYRGRDGVP